MERFIVLRIYTSITVSVEKMPTSGSSSGGGGGRTGSVNKQYASLFDTYRSPVDIPSFLALDRVKIPLFAMDLADYARAAHARLQHLLGSVHNDARAVVKVLRNAIARGDIRGKRPADFFTNLVARYREFLIITFQRTNRIEDAGSTRGTSQASMIFNLLALALLIQSRIMPAALFVRKQDRCDVDYDDVLMNHMAIHGSTYTIRTYTQMQVYKSWMIMTKNFVRLDISDISDLINFRMALLRRTAELIYMSERGKVAKVLDMSDLPSSGYVRRNGNLRQCAPRFVVEVMVYYVMTETLIYMHYDSVVPSLASVDQTREFTSTLLSSIVSSYAVDSVEESGDDTAYATLFTKWAASIRNNLAVVESRDTNDHTAVERLSDTIRDQTMPPAYRLRFRFDNFLMPVSEMGQLEEGLYSTEKIAFMRSYVHMDMAFFTDGTHGFPEDPLIPRLAGMHIIQQFILNRSVEILFYDEVTYTDYDLVEVLLPTPETTSSDKRGQFSVNNFAHMNVGTDTLFDLDSSGVWSLPITLRNIDDTPSETMPAVIKLAASFYVYYDGQFYSVEDEYEAFALWVLIIVNRCRCHYVRRGRGRMFDMSFLGHYILERLHEVDVEFQTPLCRDVLASQMGETCAGDVVDPHLATTVVQAKRINSMFEGIDDEDDEVPSVSHSANV